MICRSLLLVAALCAMLPISTEAKERKLIPWAGDRFIGDRYDFHSPLVEPVKRAKPRKHRVYRTHRHPSIKLAKHHPTKAAPANNSRPKEKLKPLFEGNKLTAAAPTDVETLNEAIGAMYAVPDPPHVKLTNELRVARAYLVATATPGGTMTMMGPVRSIGMLHPQFALRLAKAIRQVRKEGLAKAGVFSAYRAPAFGVGGFSDKFNSLHSYGLAVDICGIGSAGSIAAKLWHRVAAQHGVYGPYGPYNRAEFNHMQPTFVKIVMRSDSLRKTITAKGPVSVERMWRVADALLDRKPTARQVAALAHRRGHGRYAGRHHHRHRWARV